MPTRPRNRPVVPFGDLPDEAFARLDQIIPTVVPVSLATWWRWVKAGKAPAPCRPAGCHVALWHVGDLRAWIRKQT
jgi:hypothetical protein